MAIMFSFFFIGLSIDKISDKILMVTIYINLNTSINISFDDQRFMSFHHRVHTFLQDFNVRSYQV
jgi:hypothetical protein